MFLYIYLFNYLSIYFSWPFQWVCQLGCLLNMFFFFFFASRFPDFTLFLCFTCPVLWLCKITYFLLECLIFLSLPHIGSGLCLFTTEFATDCATFWTSLICFFQQITMLKSWKKKKKTFEPAHEIMVLFVLRKLILQTRMRSHPMGLDVWFLDGPFVYFRTSCVRTAKALARLRGCAGSPEPSLVAYVISTIVSWSGSFNISRIILPRLQSYYVLLYSKNLRLEVLIVGWPRVSELNAIFL